MIVPDVNLLLHAHDSQFRKHFAARRWWETLLNGSHNVGHADMGRFPGLRWVNPLA